MKKIVYTPNHINKEYPEPTVKENCLAVLGDFPVTGVYKQSYTADSGELALRITQYNPCDLLVLCHLAERLAHATGLSVTLYGKHKQGCTEEIWYEESEDLPAQVRSVAKSCEWVMDSWKQYRTSGNAEVVAKLFVETVRLGVALCDEAKSLPDCFKARHRNVNWGGISGVGYQLQTTQAAHELWVKVLAEQVCPQLISVCAKGLGA